MKCIAIDDEPLALTQLSDYISQVPFLSLVKSCQDAFEAMKILSEEEVDLIFVDINMPEDKVMPGCVRGNEDIVRRGG